MATFVRVTRDQSGDFIFVNMDKVILMERSQEHTILKPNNAELMNEFVKETPEQILDLIRHERKSQV
jgi:hypothetical protein